MASPEKNRARKLRAKQQREKRQNLVVLTQEYNRTFLEYNKFCEYWETCFEYRSAMGKKERTHLTKLRKKVTELQEAMCAL